MKARPVRRGARLSGTVTGRGRGHAARVSSSIRASATAAGFFHFNSGQFRWPDTLPAP